MRSTWPVAALGLVAGFSIAVATDVRWLGGIVLIAVATWCGLRWLSAVGRATTFGLVLVFIAGFVLSHPLGNAIGAWPSVLTVAAAVGAVSWFVADRRAPLSARSSPSGR